VIVVYLARIEALLVGRLLVRRSQRHVCKLSFFRHDVVVLRKFSSSLNDGRQKRWDGSGWALERISMVLVMPRLSPGGVGTTSAYDETAETLVSLVCRVARYADL
jgi:hypothetical protein